MKAIMVIADSLNRHYLPPYGNSWVKAPNIERFAQKSITFDNHWLGSAPCMPARRDMLTGRLNFLEREWGGLEPFDVPFPSILQDQAGIFCHMETDHYHYFHIGGENYYMPFNSWSFHRGQESDTFVSRIASPDEPEHLGKWRAQYAKNQTAFKTEADYPSPKTFQGAIEWLKNNEGEDDYFLWVEAFDPHEPFDCPEEYLKLYGDDWEGPLYNWSGYDIVDSKSEATNHLRLQYAATLTMTDHWFGKLMDEIERQDGLEDTLIIFTTDHGHMLGERNRTGKNNWHSWNEMAHLPLIVHLPGSHHAGERRNQLTQNIDIMPTLLDYFDISGEYLVQGESWMEILYRNTPAKRRAALYGWFGQTINITDGKYTYFKAPISAENKPLYRYFLTPGTFSFRDMCSKDFYDQAKFGNFLPFTDYPCLRAEVNRPRSDEWAESMLFDIRSDYGQLDNLTNTKIEQKYIALLHKTMEEMEAPDWQFDRVGLTNYETS
jgi:arylsulfatase A-like enzyme